MRETHGNHTQVLQVLCAKEGKIILHLLTFDICLYEIALGNVILACLWEIL